MRFCLSATGRSMSLRMKVLVVLLPAMLALLGAMYALMADVVSSGFADVEHQQVLRNASRVQAAISHESEAVRSTALDWGSWSELYRWTTTRDPNFLQGSLVLGEDGLSHLQVRFLAIVDETLQPLQAEELSDEGESVPLSAASLSLIEANRRVLQPTARQGAVVKIVLGDGVPVILASAPIVDDDTKLPERGHVIVARYLDADYMKAFSERVALDLALFPADDRTAPDVEQARAELDQSKDGTAVRAINDDRISGYFDLLDEAGQRMVTIRLSQERPIYQQGQISLRYLLAVFVLAAAAVLAALTLLLNNVVLSRILLLSSEVNQISRSTDLSLRTSAHGRDEIGRLSREMNEMLHVIELASEKERKYIREIDASLKLAASIQSGMLPTDFSVGGDVVDIHAALIPAKSVGGDFYDFFWLDAHRLAFVVADVSGKGVAAGLFMVKAKDAIKAAAGVGLSPAEIMFRANNELSEGNDEAMFVTALFGVLDVTNGELELVNAGHNPPYIIPADGSGVAERKLPEDVALGAMEGIPYASSRLQLQPNDTLFLYTDGVNEAMNPHNEEFGYARMMSALGEEAEASVARNQSVIDAIKAFVRDAEQSDDITVLTVRWRMPGHTLNRRKEDLAKVA